MTPEAFLKAYEIALGSQRWDDVAPLLHQDVCLTWSEGTFQGKDAARAAFERTFSLIEDEAFTISNPRWIRRSPDYAILVFDFAWSGRVNGKPASGGGRGTSMLVNEGGEWRLLVEHLGPTAST